jgi:2-methylcitrate dehydratase PrpD
MDETVIQQLTQYMAEAPGAELPSEVTQKAKHHVLDTLAAMVSGSRLKPGRLGIQYARAQEGRREAGVIASDVVTTATTAAFANGILAHADETDDSHQYARLHPGCSIVPAAWAMAERQNSEGKALLRAVVLGYDIGGRVNRALRPKALGNHSSHSIGGTFGAAAAAGSLALLDAQKNRYLLSYAAQQASGVRSWVADDEHVEKAFDFGGMPARNGVMAALLVESGFTGMRDVFQGERNFLDAYSPSPDPQELVRELGGRYEIMLTSIKKFPAGFPIQAAADALLLIIDRHSIRPEDVLRVAARLPEDGARTVNDRSMADINLQYVLAVMLLDGKLEFQSAHDYGRMQEREVLEMKARIRLQADEELTRAAVPAQAIVELTTRDGRTLREHVVSFRGAAENPMTTEEVEEKARGLMAPVLGSERVEKLLAVMRELESLANVSDLRGLLAAG